MRSTTAITLVLLGGGVIATSVVRTGQCKDPVTGQPIACSGSGGSGSGGWGSRSSGGISTASASSSVSRGGFGGAGATASAGS